MPQRIPTHKPARLGGRPKRDESSRPNAAARGYCDKAHRAWRKAVLTRDAWQCQACGRACHGRKTRGEQAAASGSNVPLAAAIGLAHAEGRVGRIAGASREVNPGCLLCICAEDTPYRELAPR